MMHRILFLLLIYFNLLHSNFSQDIIPEKQTYVGIYGKSLTLKWKLELDNDDKLIAVNLHYVPENGVRKKLFGSTGYSEPKAEPYTETTFGSRMKASISKEESKYEVTIDNLRYNDSGSFSLEVYIQLSGEKGVQQFEKVIKISEVKAPSKDYKVDGNETSNTTAIVLGVIGGIVFILLIALLVYCCFKKNICGSIGSKNNNTPYPVYDQAALSKDEYEKPQYCEATSLVQKPEEIPPAQNYMVLGPDGGRKGERHPPPAPSHYREVKNFEDEIAPSKPVRGVLRQDSFGNSVSDDVEV